MTSPDPPRPRPRPVDALQVIGADLAVVLGYSVLCHCPVSLRLGALTLEIQVPTRPVHLSFVGSGNDFPLNDKPLVVLAGDRQATDIPWASSLSRTAIDQQLLGNTECPGGHL